MKDIGKDGYLGSESNSKPEFVENIDPKLKNNPDIKVGEDTVKYNDLISNFPINKQVPTRMLVYWDDICQYTSIGLIDLINNLCKTNAKIDIEHFLTRGNDYINGMTYVYKLFDGVLTPKQIDKIKHDYYWILIQSSLKSSVYESLLNINTFFNKLTIFFPYRFTNCDKLEQGLNKIFNPDLQHKTEFKFEYRSSIGFNDLLYRDHYNAVMTPSMSSTYKFILSKDLKKIDIFGSSDHNGLDDDLINLLNKYQRFPKPNYCDLHFYYEQIAK